MTHYTYDGDAPATGVTALSLGDCGAWAPVAREGAQPEAEHAPATAGTVCARYGAPADMVCRIP